ncbi:hypothetical protein CPB83DRAFT_893978 [Crepidotus variabilis]|uniref:Uncharacterized protein n=1 Tax=Crepidotus variabilis TaxID=179855 RepID=A0A9P6JQN9_9AGAR|nr:hypothetical protein CPB83DRAFT_893978 [Crepidotus variabilis]
MTFANKSHQRLPRPRGLWKAARETQPRLDISPQPAKRPSPVDHYNNPIPYIDDAHRFYSTQHRHDNDEDHIFSDGDCDSDSSTSSLQKRRRISESPPTSEELEDHLNREREEVIFWDYSRKCSPHPERLSRWTTRTKLMDITSTVGGGSEDIDRIACDLDDWEDLKELFAKAVDMFESQEPTETMPLLRGVIHECHRFMKMYQDPSVLFATPPSATKPLPPPRPEERFVTEWLTERPALYPPPMKKDQSSQTSQKPTMKPAVQEEKKCKCKDLPTAFHTVFGTTLFLFGNLISQDPSLAVEGEPTTPTPYWLSAIDVFQMGENLPIKVSGRTCPSAPEDWRMAIVWGRTLVNLADEVLTRQKAASSGIESGPSPAVISMPSNPIPSSMMSMFQSTTTAHHVAPPAFQFPSSFFTGSSTAGHNQDDDPNWPPESPFALIAARRSPASFRISLNSTTPSELLQFAQDQFSRGIFHMPHPHRARGGRSSIAFPNGNGFATRPHMMSKDSSSSIDTHTSTSTSPLSTKSTSPSMPAGTEPALPFGSFSRAKELYTIASEVLLLAEKLFLPSERYHWAYWAGGVFSQMKMENNSLETEDEWKGLLARARGRCCLVMGSAKAEELEAALERGEFDVLKSEDAQEGREVLRDAIGYLERAIEAAHDQSIPDSPVKELSLADTEFQAIIEDGEAVRVVVDDSDEEENELRTLLAEALLTLANLIEDKAEREVLYAKAQKEGRGAFELDDDEKMDESG